MRLTPFLALVALTFIDEVLAQNQSSTGACAPNIAGVGGNVTLVCNLSTSELVTNAQRNLELVLEELNKFEEAKLFYVEPAVEHYINHPTEANWGLVMTMVSEMNERIKAAIHSAVDYDSGIQRLISGTNDLNNLHALLFGKLSLIVELPKSPPSTDDTIKWYNTLVDLNRRLRIEIAKLASLLKKTRPS